MWGTVKKAKKARALVERMLNEPFEQTKFQRVRANLISFACLVVNRGLLQSVGHGGTSLVDSLLRDHEGPLASDTEERREFLIKSAAAQIYGGSF